MKERGPSTHSGDRELLDVEAGSDDELALRGDWLSRLMFAPFLDPALAYREHRGYEQWLHDQGYRLA